MKTFALLLAVPLTAVVFIQVAAVAQDCGRSIDGFVYGLSEDGVMSINATGVKTYASDFDIDVDTDPLLEVDIDNPKDPWSSLDVDGPDRYALQRGGRMKKNDKTFFDLATPEDDVWLDMVARGGHTFSIRTDGGLAVDGDVVAVHERGNYFFLRVASDGTDAYCLRSDGKVFVNDASDPLFRFTAGIGDRGEGDGDSVETLWRAITLDPDGQFLYALRGDGHVFRGRLTAPQIEGERVAQFPHDGSQVPLVGELYFDIAFTADGTLHALQGDGRVYTGDNELVPMFDLPGDAEQVDRVHVDLDSTGGDWLSLRSDGRVYLNGAQEEILDLPGQFVGSIAFGTDAPVLPSSGQKKPKATTIKPQTVVGTPLSIPVVATDVDTCPEQLVVTPVLPLPPGSVWDAGSRTLDWAAPGPAGKYKFNFTVSDGTFTQQYKHVIKLSDADTNPDKNKPPLIAKYGSPQAVVGFPYQLPIIADDRDGDPLLITVDPTAYPFTAGATFDPVTRMFSWTPAPDDQGTVKLKFTVSDGAKQAKIKIKLKVKNSLIL